MTEFEEALDKIICNGVAPITNEEFYLKSNLLLHFKDYQQQALPVVPECVWKILIKYKGSNQSVYGLLKALELSKGTDIYNWIFSEGNQDIFALAFITGKYEVEKPQLFYLKHIDMSKSDAQLNWYLAKGPDNVLRHQGIKEGKLPKLKCILKLTQQEIDRMETGSYEQIPVPVEDGE